MEEVVDEFRWKEALAVVQSSFGPIDELKDVLFLIGVQELGHGFRKFNKNEKMDLLHVGTCVVLAPYGYYEYRGRDDDEWPHWEALKKLPHLSSRNQELLLKSAIAEFLLGAPQ